jgi:two-component system, NarL family, sensor histidine kinase UhpB
MQEDSNNRLDLLQTSFKNLGFAIEQIRQFSNALIAPSLGDVTLVQAIKDLIDIIRMTSSLKLEFNNNDYDGQSIDNAIQLMLYRIVQEQTNNIIKHSGAKHVSINLSSTPTQIMMVIEDDGVGFDPKKTHKGIGLRNMAHRAEFYNGKIRIISAPGKGCRLELFIPL